MLICHEQYSNSVLICSHYQIKALWSRVFVFYRINHWLDSGANGERIGQIKNS